MKARRAPLAAAASLLARLDPALLLIPLIGLVAVWPFLTESLPSTDDGALHMRRLAEIDRCLRHGVLPMRWAPDFAHGYGYPFFNYYASLSSYVAAFWRLLGLNVPQAIAAATVLAIWASGWGTYLLGKAIYGAKGGLVAATAYMYAPYQFYDSAYRGNLAELWALALLPWVLWAGQRAASASRRRWAAIVPLAAAYAALIYTHNVYALISSPVLGLYLLVLWWSVPGLGGGTRTDVGAVSKPREPAADSSSRAIGSAATMQGPSDTPVRRNAWLQRFNVPALLRLGAGIGLGLALSAFFWLPAFGERGWTRFSTELVDYRTFFLDLRELLALPPRVDLSLLNFYPPRSLNGGMLAVIGGGLLWRAWRVRKPALPALSGFVTRSALQVGFFAMVFVGAAFLTIRASDLLWRTVPLLGYALIPWRFLGIASLAGSVVAGWALSDAPHGRTAVRPYHLAVRPYHSAVRPYMVGTCVAIVLVVAAALPWTFAQPVGQRTEYGVADIVGWEYSSKLIGTTAKNEFLPIWSSRLPPEPADPVVLTEADPIIARLDASSLPEGARVISSDYQLMRAELVIDTPRAFRARYKQLYFPGWQVMVDGRPAAQIATAPYGLLGFEVPEGRYRIVVRPATTPLRLAGSVVSGLGLALAVALLYVARRHKQARLLQGLLMQQRDSSTPLRRRTRVRSQNDDSTTALRTQSVPVDATPSDRYNGREGRPASPADAWIHALILAALAVLLLIVKEGWVDRTENLFRARRLDPAAPVPLPGVPTQAAVNFGDAFTLYGYELPRRSTVAGEPLRVDLYLGARHPPEARAGQAEAMAYARLVDDEGRLWSLPYNGAPEGHRPPPATTIWPTDAYGHWAYVAYTLPGTPPGTYWIEVGLFERGTWRGLNVLDEAGRIAGLSTRIGPVEIARSVPETLDVERPQRQEVGPDLRYLGSTLDAGPRQAGDELGITLFWQAVQRPASDYTLELTWRGEDGALLLGEGLPLGRHEHATSAWDEDEIVRSPHRLRVPANAPAGAYRVEARVIDQVGQPVAPPIVVVEGTLEPTDRQMAVPEDIQRRADANLGERVSLLGYDLPGRDLSAGQDGVRVAKGETLPVTLYWQAQREMTTSYKVFVQLVGADAQTASLGAVAQSDAMPANWQRPTTGWALGEVIVDEHTLSVPAGAPPGTYTLIAGMYDEGTLQRLAVLDASGVAIGDAVPLEGVVIE